MSIHAYPLRAVLGDYACSAAGLASCGALLALGPAHPAMTVVLGVLLMLFAVHALRTVRRNLTRFEVDDERIASRGPRPGTLAWDDLSQVRLAYYSTHRDGSKGWLHLSLAGGRRRLGLDSSLDGFTEVAARAAAAAAANGLWLDPASAANFKALGLGIDGGRARG